MLNIYSDQLPPGLDAAVLSAAATFLLWLCTALTTESVVPTAYKQRVTSQLSLLNSCVTATPAIPGKSMQQTIPSSTCAAPGGKTEVVVLTMCAQHCALSAGSAAEVALSKNVQNRDLSSSAWHEHKHKQHEFS
jgi:hypothetical protein